MVSIKKFKMQDAQAMQQSNFLVTTTLLYKMAGLRCGAIPGLILAHSPYTPP